jgi:hypothetical protein
MAWQNIPNNPYWQYEDTPLDPGGAQTALWQTSTNGVRTSVRGEQIYVNCKHKLLHPTQDSFPNEINKTFWIGVEPTGIILIDELDGTTDGTTLSTAAFNRLTRDMTGWQKGTTSAWSLGEEGTTELFNASNVGGSTSDSAMAKIINLSGLGLATENQLQINMTYSAWDDNSPYDDSTPISVYVHVWGLVDVSSTPNSLIANLGATNGNMWAYAVADFSVTNLRDGSLLTSADDTKGFTAAIQLTPTQDTGTPLLADAVAYSTTIDLSGYSLDTLAQYDYFVIGIAKNSVYATDRPFAIHDIKVIASTGA